MKKLTILFSSAALIVCAGLLFNSCSSSSSPNSGPPTAVSVTSYTNTSITVGWTRNSADNSTDTIIVTNAAGASQGTSPVLITSQSSGTVNGLAANVAYTVSVGTTGGRTMINYTISGPNVTLMMQSGSATTINAKWVRPSGDAGADADTSSWLIGPYPGGSVVAGGVSNDGTAVGVGLSEGQIYTLAVTFPGGWTDTMSWMTAERFTGLQLYEKADPNAGDPSGLDLAQNAVQAISLSGASNADLVLDDISGGSGITLEAGAVLNASWNATRVDPTAQFQPGGLNNYYRSTSYSGAIDSMGMNYNSYDIPSDASYGTKGSAILITQTANGNLALIEIVPDPSTGLLYSTSAGGYKYITVNVSYQATSTAPYAGRGRPHLSAPEVRKSAH